jgi:hypothetical protein
VRVNPRAELANIPGAEQEFVACDLGVGRSLAEGGNEELRPTMHEFWKTLSGGWAACLLFGAWRLECRTSDRAEIWPGLILNRRRVLGVSTQH